MRELVGYLNWVEAIWTYQYLWTTSTTENHARCQEWVWPPWCSLQSGTSIMKVGTGILAFLPHRCTSGLIGYPCQLWVKLAIQVNLLNWWRVRPVVLGPDTWQKRADTSIIYSLPPNPSERKTECFSTHSSYSREMPTRLLHSLEVRSMHVLQPTGVAVLGGRRWCMVR